MSDEKRMYKVIVSYPDGMPGMEVRAHDDLVLEVEATYIERDGLYLGEGRLPWNARAMHSATIDGKHVTELIEYVRDGLWAAKVQRSA